MKRHQLYAFIDWLARLAEHEGAARLLNRSGGMLRPIRGDVGRLLTRIERAAPPGDSAPTAGNPAANAGTHAMSSVQMMKIERLRYINVQAEED